MIETTSTPDTHAGREVLLIGIDCAAQERDIGLAQGWFRDGRAIVEKERMGSGASPIVETIASWIGECRPALLAIDAPLGWPAALGEYLAAHNAGEPVSPNEHDMFRRYTDTVVRSKLGKQPFDVGSNLIARAARKAVNILHELRQRLKLPIPLAWSPQFGNDVYAIEVYPAATMCSRGITVRNYKKLHDQRVQLMTHLSRELDCGSVMPGVLDRADRIDACTCLLAAADFLRGEAVPPGNDHLQRAQKEGWIWFRQPLLTMERLVR